MLLHVNTFTLSSKEK